MADSRLSSQTRVSVGNEDYLIQLADIAPSGQTDPRYIKSLDIAGTVQSDNEATLATEGIETIVNKHGHTINTQMLDGAGTDMLETHQNVMTSLMAIKFMDTLTFYLFPVSWLGNPISNPTGATITVDMPFLQRDIGIDGAAAYPGDPAVTRLLVLNEFGSVVPRELSDIDANAGDRCFVEVVTKSGTDQTMKLTTSGDVDITKPVSIKNPGIYELVVDDAAVQDMQSDMKLVYGGDTTNFVGGYLMIGPNQTID